MADLRGLRERAAVLAGEGRRGEAADLLRAALAVEPEDVETRRWLAELLRGAGRAGEAVAAYRAVADRLARDGRPLKALAISRTILELEPEHVATHAGLAGLYAHGVAAPGAEGAAEAAALPATARALPRVPIFSELAPDAFVALARGLGLRRVEQGEEVLREGEEGTSLFVVADGRLAVSRRDDRGAAMVLARLGEGDLFGEMALLSGAPRAATVTAEEASELLELRADALREVAARHPQVAASLGRFCRQRVLANALAMSPVFRPFAREERRRVVERFRAREVAAGEVIVREGEPSDGLYVVLDCAVDVLKRKVTAELVVGQLRGGDLFGEMSCLRKAPASATVRVRRAGTLLRLPREAFDELVLTHPQVLEHVAELAEERVESLDAILAGRAQWTDEGLVLL